MISGYYATVLLVIFSAHLVLSQDCIHYGKSCYNHASCCGGCCIDRTCVDTYQSCYNHGDLCLDHNCPPGEECYLYQPNCIGCAAYPACRDLREKVEKMISPHVIRV